MTLEDKAMLLYDMIDDIVADNYQQIQDEEYYNNQVYIHWQQVLDGLAHTDEIDAEWFGFYLDDERKWLRNMRRTYGNAPWFDEYESALLSMTYL